MFDFYFCDPERAELFQSPCDSPREEAKPRPKVDTEWFEIQSTCGSETGSHCEGTSEGAPDEHLEDDARESLLLAKVSSLARLNSQSVERSARMQLELSEKDDALAVLEAKCEGLLQEKVQAEAKIEGLLRELEACEEGRAIEKAWARRRLCLDKRRSNDDAAPPHATYEWLCDASARAQELQKENKQLLRQLEAERSCRSSARLRAQLNDARVAGSSSPSSGSRGSTQEVGTESSPGQSPSEIDSSS